MILHDRNEFEELLKARRQTELKATQYGLMMPDPDVVLQNVNRYTNEMPEMNTSDALTLSMLDVPPTYNAAREIAQITSSNRIYDEAKLWRQLQEQFQYDHVEDNMKMTWGDLWTAGLAPGGAKPGDVQYGVWAFAALDAFFQTFGPGGSGKWSVGSLLVNAFSPGQPMQVGRSVAYLRDLREYDKLLKQGYSRTQAQKQLSIDLSGSTVKNLGRDLSTIDELRQQIDMIKEAHRMGGEPVLAAMFRAVSNGEELNFDRSRWAVLESVKAEKTPHFVELTTKYGYSADEARNFIYKNIGDPLKGRYNAQTGQTEYAFDDDGQITYSSFANPNKVNFYAGRFNQKFFWQGQTRQDYFRPDWANKDILLEYSPGKVTASEFFEPGTTAFRTMSGAIDMAHQIIPELLGAKGVSTVKGLNKGLLRVNPVLELLDDGRLVKGVGKSKNVRISPRNLADNVLEEIGPRIDGATGSGVFDDLVDSAYQLTTNKNITSDFSKTRKALRKMKKNNVVPIFNRVPRFYQLSKDEILNQPTMINFFKAVAEEDNLFLLGTNPYIRRVNMPAKIQEALIATDDWVEVQKMFGQMIDTGFNIQNKYGQTVPWILPGRELPKTGSLVLNRFLAKTGIKEDAAFRTFGSFTGSALRPVKEGARKVVKTILPGKLATKAPNKLVRVEDSLEAVIDTAEAIAEKGDFLAKLEGVTPSYAIEKLEKASLPKFEKYLGFSSNFNSTYDPYYRKLLGVVPEMGIPLNNLNQGYRQIVSHLQVNEYDHIEANKILQEFLSIDPLDKSKYRDFAFKQASRDYKKIKAKGGNYEYIAAHIEEMFAGLQKSKLYGVDKNMNALPNFGNNYRGYELNLTGSPIDEFNEVVTSVSASMLTEMQDNIAPLMDYRLVDRALSPLFRAYPDGQFTRTSILSDTKKYVKYKTQHSKVWGTKDGVELPNPFEDGIINVKRLEDNFMSNLFGFYTRNVFKPLVLMRFAFFTRVFMEEQARIAMKGLSGIYNKPWQYMTWLAAHNPDSKVGRLLEALPFNKGYQKAKYSDDAIDFLMEEEVMEAMQKTMRYEDLASGNLKRNKYQAYKGKYVEEMNQREITESVYHELRLLKGDPITQAVARYGYGSDELTQWLMSPAGRDARLQYVQKAGRATEDFIMDGSQKLDQHLQYLEYRIRKITGGTVDLALDAVKDKNGKFSYKIRTDVETGNPVIRQLIADGKLVKFGTKGTNQKDVIDFMTDEKFFRTYNKNKVLDELNLYYEKNKGINPGVLSVVEDITPDAGRANNVMGDVQDMMEQFFGTYFEKLMTKPIGILNRSTTFKQFRWMYIQERFRDMTPALRKTFIAEAKDAGIPRQVIDELEGLARLLKPGKFDDYNVMHTESKAYGLAGVKELLYDTRKRHTVSDKLVNIFPFVEVWFEVFQTWGRLFADKPYILREANVFNRGAHSANTLGPSSDDGFFSPDPMDSEKDVFVYPFGGFLSNLIFDDELIGGEQQVQISPRGQVQGVNLLAQGFVPGPNSLVAFGVDRLLPKAENAFTKVGIKYGWANELEKALFGDFPPPEKLINVFSGSPVYKKLWAALRDEDSFDMITDGSDQTERMRAKKTIELFRWGVAAGEPERLYKAGKLDKYLNKMYPNENIAALNQGQIENAYLEYAKEKSGTLFLFEFLVQYFGPTSFKPEFFIADEQGKLWGQATLYEEYIRIRDKNNQNDIATFNEFAELYGVEYPYLLSPRSQTEGAKLPATVRVQNFQKNNPDIFKNLKVSGYYLNIDNPYEEKSYQEILEYKNALSPDQYRRAVNDTIGFFRYKTYSQKVDGLEALSSTKKTILKRAYRNELKLALPGFQAEEYGLMNPPSVSDIFTEMREQWLTNPAILELDAGKGFADIMQYWQQAEILSQQYSTSSNPDWWLTSEDPRAKALRIYVYNRANGIIEQYPEFWGVWTGVMLKLYRDDQEVLDYFPGK